MSKHLVVCLLLLGYCSYGQQGMPRYYEYLGLTQRADSAAQAGRYTQAAGLYTRAARVKVERGIPISRAETLYHAAGLWASGNVPDSAFHQLNLIATLGFAQADSLAHDATFARLRSDARWQLLLARVRCNAARARRLDLAYQQRTAFAGPTETVVFYPPNEYVRQFIYNDTLPLTSVNYRQFRLFFRGNSSTATHLPAVQEQLATATSRILEVLHQSTYYRGIYLVLVDSKQELRELTGLSPGGGFALAGQDAVFLVNNPTRRLQAKHELFHLMASEVWGISYSRLLNEGAAVYCDNECYYENPIYGINAYLLQSGKLLPVAALISDFDNIAHTNEVGAYLQSAGLFKYLYEQYGVDKMRQLWRAGFDNFEQIYGFSVKRLEHNWKVFIRKTTVPKNLDWEKLSREGCG